jgi:gamma-glutamylcyclotransferase (GGCT)/AIG2-like uncharacterized protein YtfP
MELWIRSQNKGALIKVEMLGKTDETIHSYNGINKTVLGTYKSDERALEVLDEIQKYINNNCEFIEQKTHTKMGTYTNKIDTYVYEMPEE